jgi:hypothetical protein
MLMPCDGYSVTVADVNERDELTRPHCVLHRDMEIGCCEGIDQE